MATTSQREAVKGTESSWTTKQKNRLLSEFDSNVKRIRELQLEVAERSYIIWAMSTFLTLVHKSREQWNHVIMNNSVHKIGEQ
ncbi:unnamed protein product [Brachionus calyciflorus]|uniref:Uncharacterized protein n=1 Tax=Brachionus calyciflorus TaxID=104777 RepID=A0A814FJ96_9BILA|nr:unnamed protein product [Brachionus calyciflorus]